MHRSFTVLDREAVERQQSVEFVDGFARGLEIVAEVRTGQKYNNEGSDPVGVGQLLAQFVVGGGLAGHREPRHRLAGAAATLQGWSLRTPGERMLGRDGWAGAPLTAITLPR